LKLAPLEINKHEQHFLKRKSELQRLARDIEESYRSEDQSLPRLW